VAVDGEGDIYFFHAGTGSTQWDKPRDPSAPPLLESYLKHKKQMEAKAAATAAAGAESGQQSRPAG
jgi:hypothetical protein